MSEKRDMAAKLAPDEVKAALSDHHLDEVAVMIERLQAEQRTAEEGVGCGAHAHHPQPG